MVLRRSIQVIFLALFFLFIYIGKVQVWMFLFLGGLLGAIFFGRFYCGWICPINTLIEGVNFSYKKMKFKRKEVPNFIKSPIIRYSALALFIVLIIFTLKTGKKLPMLPALAIFGTGISLFFVPLMWHRYLCPYGTLLNLTGKLAVFHWKVDQENCSRCGLCKKICQGEAIQMQSRDIFPYIDKGLCLGCTFCAKKCPKKAIEYSPGN